MFQIKRIITMTENKKSNTKTEPLEEPEKGAVEGLDGAAEETDKEAARQHRDKPLRKPWYKRYMSMLTILALVLVGYIMFFSESSVTNQIEREQIIDSLRAEIEICNDSTEYYRELNSRLTNDPEEMERIVREYHNMNHPDEDVYVFKKSGENSEP